MLDIINIILHKLLVMLVINILQKLHGLTMYLTLFHLYTEISNKFPLKNKTVFLNEENMRLNSE